MLMVNRHNKGFTIIEVVLVLAIAGLVFLMVFIALPALQAAQRDTQRRADVAIIIAAVKNYTKNNHGKAPPDSGSGSNILSSDEYGNWVEMRRGTTGILQTYAKAGVLAVSYLQTS